MQPPLKRVALRERNALDERDADLDAGALSPGTPMTQKEERRLREVAQSLAARHASEEGARAMKQAAEATRKRVAETLKASRVDAALLLKRVTI